MVTSAGVGGRADAGPGIPYRRASSRGRLDSDNFYGKDPSPVSLMERVRRVFKRALHGGGESPTGQEAPPQQQVVADEGCHVSRQPLSLSSTCLEDIPMGCKVHHQEEEEGDSMGSNSTDAPPGEEAVRPTIISSSNTTAAPPPPATTTSATPPMAPVRYSRTTVVGAAVPAGYRYTGSTKPPAGPSNSTLSRPSRRAASGQASCSRPAWSSTYNSSSSSRLQTTAVFSDRPNPFIDESEAEGDSKRLAAAVAMPGNGALIPKTGEFSRQRRATTVDEERSVSSAPPVSTAEVFARMRMLGQKCKDDSGRHKLKRDPITGKKLLILR